MMNETVIIPRILLPTEGTDMTKYSVVACDQFTSEPEYWRRLADFVGDAPSTLKTILPEAFLADGDIFSLYAEMGRLLPSLVSFEGFVYVRRRLKSGFVREGVVIAVDLENYDYRPRNDADIKATERTVEERLPSRVEIRRGAPLEFPHVMLLFDDPEHRVMRAARQNAGEILYDFELNMGGGAVSGRAVSDCEKVKEAFASVRKDFLFAVGDGNHSLAAAKEWWNIVKSGLSEKERQSHPARFALAEAVNLHDESLKFEPIHRIVTGADADFVKGLCKACEGSAAARVRYNGRDYKISIPENPADAIADIQNYIDAYLSLKKGAVCDYIHGDENLTRLEARTGGAAVFMPCPAKDGLFDYAARRGVLPRKSFSMGCAEDKRYYLEARKIVK